MTDQPTKTSTEALTKSEQQRVQAAQTLERQQQPPVNNDHVAPGAEKFTSPATGQSNSALEVEAQYLKQRLHDLEVVVHAYLSRQTSVGHSTITSWVDKVKTRLRSAAWTQQDPAETGPDTASTKKAPAAPSRSSTAAPSPKGTGVVGDKG